MRSLIRLAGLLALLLGAPAHAEPPRLLVLVVVDQMRADYFDWYGSHWKGGLRRLYDRGAWMRNARTMNSVATRRGEPSADQMDAYWSATRLGRVRRTMNFRIGCQITRGRSTTAGSLRNSSRKSRTASGVAASGVPRFTNKRWGTAD